MKVLFGILLSLIIITSCNRKKNNLKHDNSGAFEIILTQDVDTAIFYYDTGHLKTKTTLNKKGKKHGLERGYYRSGNLKYIFNYVDGRKEGDAFWYHDKKGVLDIRGTYKNDQKIGEFFAYDILGNIYQYSYYSHINGTLGYRLTYDSVGRVIQKEGMPLIDIDPLIDTLHIEDQLIIKLHVVCPPDYKLHFYVLEVGDNDEELSRTEERLVDDYYIINKRFSEIGKHTWGVTVKLVSEVDGSFFTRHDILYDVIVIE